MEICTQQTILSMPKPMYTVQCTYTWKLEANYSMERLNLSARGIFRVLVMVGC